MIYTACRNDRCELHRVLRLGLDPCAVCGWIKRIALIKTWRKK